MAAASTFTGSNPETVSFICAYLSGAMCCLKWCACGGACSLRQSMKSSLRQAQLSRSCRRCAGGVLLLLLGVGARLEQGRRQHPHWATAHEAREGLDAPHRERAPPLRRRGAHRRADTVRQLKQLLLDWLPVAQHPSRFLQPMLGPSCASAVIWPQRTSPKHTSSGGEPTSIPGRV